MKKPAHHLITEVPSRQSKVEMMIGIDLGDVWSHYCTLNEEGEVVDRGRFRTTPKGLEKWFTDVLQHEWRWKREAAQFRYAEGPA
jgi:transposase